MAAPVDAARVTTDGSTEATSQALNLPGGIAAGHILLAIVRSPAATTFSWPSGWVELDESTADASDDVTSVAWRIADGTEGATITVTLGTARRMAGLCYRITGGDALEISAVAAANGQPNSPSYNLSGGLARDVLWLSLGGCIGDRSLTSGPSGYANSTFANHTGATGASQCGVFGASLQVAADLGEDPGAWTLDTTTTYMAFTVAVYASAAELRVSQEPVETILHPTSGDLRVSQLPAEAIVEPEDAALRLSQLPVEAIVDVGGARMRTSQLPVEVILQNVVAPAAVEQFYAVVIS